MRSSPLPSKTSIELTAPGAEIYSAAATREFKISAVAAPSSRMRSALRHTASIISVSCCCIARTAVSRRKGCFFQYSCRCLPRMMRIEGVHSREKAPAPHVYRWRRRSGACFPGICSRGHRSEDTTVDDSRLITTPSGNSQSAAATSGTAVQDRSKSVRQESALVGLPRLHILLSNPRRRFCCVVGNLSPTSNFDYSPGIAAG